MASAYTPSISTPPPRPHQQDSRPAHPTFSNPSPPESLAPTKKPSTKIVSTTSNWISSRTKRRKKEQVQEMARDESSPRSQRRIQRRQQSSQIHSTILSLNHQQRDCGNGRQGTPIPHVNPRSRQCRFHPRPHRKPLQQWHFVEQCKPSKQPITIHCFSNWTPYRPLKAIIAFNSTCS